ncbi:MAG: N-acetyltransferase [Sphingomonadaceae bacterium]|nr:N-acetyltransferase [Sphingomonadaceae bacterium]
MRIRDAVPADFPAIHAVVAAAFGQPDEARLVDRLRADGDALIELVAEAHGEIVGHILFSRLGIGAAAGAALAPLAIAPAHQRRGLGGALTRAGLDRCRQRGVPAVVVLGHPDYYPRFGFDAALAGRLIAPFAGPSLMAIELRPGALADGGALRYAAAFGI